MKSKTILQFVICILLPAAQSLLPIDLIAQTPGEWTWMSGDNTANPSGVFGTQGVPNSANKPPGLYEPCEWTDNNGNFWLFGGSSSDFYSALWKYDPLINQWTWMKGPSAVSQPSVYGTQGIPSPINYPGSRGNGAATWVDASGNLWLFGGACYDFSLGGMVQFNDLWKYNIASNEWTWMKGPNIINDPGSYGILGVASPANLPPARSETSCTWTDNIGDLWLYSGERKGFSGHYGDLWRYNISTNEWTWMHGLNTLAPPFPASAVYGIQGVADPANTPGVGSAYASWKDLAGHLWFFGGYRPFFSNDLWKYDISTGLWTWMKGANTINDPGNFGTKCLSANSNVPPARFENRARVSDACGNFWNFGGDRSGVLNDLWHYNVSTNQWTWVSGDNIPNQAAVCGTQGVSDPANKPRAACGGVAWIDNNGYIWIFGGMNTGNGSNYNDLLV